jgi:hypothetical protein
MGVSLRFSAVSSPDDTIEINSDNGCMEESDEADDPDEECVPLSASESENEA